MRVPKRVLALVSAGCLAAILCAASAAAQGAAADYVPTPAFGGQPRFLVYTDAPVLLNREDVQRALASNYPEALRRRGEGGDVLVWILVDERGDVTSARVKAPSGKPALDAGALRVVSVMRFKPGRNKDEPVKVWVALPIYFRVPSEPPRAPAAGPQRPARVDKWGTPPPPFVDTPPPEPSAPPSLLNRTYVMRQLRDAFEARFPDAGPQGTATLRLHVNVAGDATTAEVGRSSGVAALDSLALSLKDVLVFVPALRSGRYAEGTAELSFRFPPKEER